MGLKRYYQEFWPQLLESLSNLSFQLQSLVFNIGLSFILFAIFRCLYVYFKKDEVLVCSSKGSVNDKKKKSKPR